VTERRGSKGKAIPAIGDGHKRCFSKIDETWCLGGKRSIKKGKRGAQILTPKFGRENSKGEGPLSRKG